jgi:hypothetical protein
MERRRVLAGCGVAIAGLLAGCPAELTGRPSPSPAPSTGNEGDTPAEKPTPTATPTPPPTPTRTPTATATPTETPTPIPDVETRRTALGAYRVGFEERKEYDRSTHVAQIGFNRAKYQGAKLRYRDALKHAESAVARFEQAGDLAAQSGVPGARRIADEAATYTRRYLIPFAERGVNAAQAAKEGRFEAAGELVAEMRATTEAAWDSSTNTVVPAGFERALGL